MFKRISVFCSKHRVLALLVKPACYFCFCIIDFYNRFMSLLRCAGLPSKKYSKLLKYKDRHHGKRCFIIATGPSLTISDLELLSNEYTFGMNSICMLYDKTGFRPTYYGIQDQFVYGSIKSKIDESYSGKDNIFISDRIARYFEVDSNWNVFPLFAAYNAFDRWFMGSFHAKFSADAYKAVYNGFSITISLIQLAVFMGFQDIYLIGADCSFSQKGQNHVAEHGVIDVDFETARDRNLAGYRAARDYAKEHGVSIFNATRGGMLELFPRVDIEDVLNCAES